MLGLVITKRRFWADRSGPVIEEARWYECRDDLCTIKNRHYNEPAEVGLRRRFRRVQHCFRFSDGNVEVVAGDEKTIRLALDVASRLGALVQGAFGEVYYLDGLQKVRHIWPDLGLPDPRVYCEEAIRSVRRDYHQTLGSLAIIAVVGAVVIYSILAHSDAIDSTQPRAPTHEEMIDEMRAAVRRGETGEVGRMLFPEDHQYYLKHSATDAPGDRPTRQESINRAVEIVNERLKARALPGEESIDESE